jgi:hypothetical protein
MRRAEIFYNLVLCLVSNGHANALVAIQRVVGRSDCYIIAHKLLNGSAVISECHLMSARNDRTKAEKKPGSPAVSNCVPSRIGDA